MFEKQVMLILWYYGIMVSNGIMVFIRVLMNIHAEHGQLTFIVFGVISCCMLSTVSYNL